MADSHAPAPRPTGAKLDRSSLERVLARAAELQGTGPDAGDAEEFSEEQLIELGKEVGLSPQHLRQALAEERTGSIAQVGQDAGGLFGPNGARAARTVPGRSADVLAAIDAWMQRQELLVVKRHHADRIVWEAHRGVFTGVKRALRVGGRDYALAEAHDVSATVIDVDDSRTHVVLDADFQNLRRRSMTQIVGSGVVGVAMTGSALVIGVMAAVAAAPVIVVTGAGIIASRAAHRRVVNRAQLALEQLLDRLERGEIGRRGADSLLGAIVAAANALPLPPKRF
ncbi:MAG TPA: hypothetical protein VN706_14970 [Gemmatimonadaceae bacterium]|nr:hypothetical protein [Gemmatimonadaceae bacterium]